MNKKSIKAVALIAAVCLSASVMAGCKTSDKTTGKLSQTQGQTDSYPLKTNETLTYWMDPNSNILATVSNLGDTPFAQTLQERTGVKIKFLHPPAGQAIEQFNLLVASAELPDLMAYPWYNFPGGAQKAISDNHIIQLNETIDKYAPNLKKYLGENPEIDKMVKTDEGSYYVFPFIRGDDILTVYNGPMMRKDWLDELGLEVPTTIDEWYVALKAFKEKKGAVTPLSIKLSDTGFGAIIGAFGVINNSYVENGKVKFGPIEQGYKDYVATMRKWYTEGLLDQDFASADGKKIDFNILNDKSGATIGYLGSNMGMWGSALKEKNPNAKLIGVPYPTLTEGETPKFSQKDFLYTPTNSVAITTKCKNVEIAARFLDYGYSQEGHLLYNFGIEGTSYSMKDGVPTYTDEVVKNPQNLSMGQALGKYTQVFSGPFVQNKNYIEQFYVMQEQKDAIKTWINTDADKYMLPLISITGEDKTELSKISNEVNTYVSEMYLKFIMGVEPIENFNDYVEQIKKMGVDRMLEIQQVALNNYNNR